MSDFLLDAIEDYANDELAHLDELFGSSFEHVKKEQAQAKMFTDFTNTDNTEVGKVDNEPRKRAEAQTNIALSPEMATKVYARMAFEYLQDFARYKSREYSPYFKIMSLEFEPLYNRIVSPEVLKAFYAQYESLYRPLETINTNMILEQNGNITSLAQSKLFIVQMLRKFSHHVITQTWQEKERHFFQNIMPKSVSTDVNDDDFVIKKQDRQDDLKAFRHCFLTTVNHRIVIGEEDTDNVVMLLAVYDKEYRRYVMHNTTKMLQSPNDNDIFNRLLVKQAKASKVNYVEFSLVNQNDEFMASLAI